MYVGYFDEFGHNGLYRSRYDEAYKTHPVFGLGGFIIPVDSIRDLSGKFRFIKENGLREEIDAKVISKGERVEHWEKKGSALLTTRNIEKYPQTRRIIFRVLNALNKLDARIVFYGQEKPRGGNDAVEETNSQRYNHAMKQLIKRVQWSLPDGENFMLILDKQGDRERMEIFVETAAFMYSNNNAVRLLEPPMEVESHLYQTVQCADWICGLLGRISAYKFDPDFAEYEWAPKYFGDRLASITTGFSKLRKSRPDDGSLDVYSKHLSSLKTCYDPTRVPTSKESLVARRNHSQSSGIDS